MKLGFIGLGIMGAPMAGHLLAGGHEVFAFSRSGVPAGGENDVGVLRHLGRAGAGFGALFEHARRHAAA